ncbi:MAG: GlxA family transcriptional regulator [Candidatus Symbiobacter sp.]|nr:GlxA family transcriptional regulator [Candidatus Symbiobacter sp.]
MNFALVAHPSLSPRPKTETQTQHFGLFLLENFTMIGLASALETLGLANHLSGLPLFDWTLFSQSGGEVAASNGTKIASDYAFDDMNQTNALSLSDCLVCGGPTLTPSPNFDRLIARLRRQAAYGSALGAAGLGTFVLAEAGLLEGYRCTTHWEHLAQLRDLYPAIDATEELYEIDRNRYSCAGGTATIDMMLALIAARHGKSLAHRVTDCLIHHRIRDASEQQRMGLRARLGVANQNVITCVELMESNLEEPLSCAELADLLHISPRQLERLFQHYLGATPARYYLALRLGHARKLLQQTSLSVLEIALASGFVSASHFSKTYSEHYGTPPSDDRTHGVSS